MRKTIEGVLAEAAIKDLQMRYCRGVDRQDVELIRSCFHPDATTDYGIFGGDVDAFVGSLNAALPTFLTTTHITGNQNVEVNGDTAWAEHYAVCTHRLAADENGPLRDFVTAVRYVDKLECRDGDWRILRRELVLDWTRTDPVADAPPDPPVPPGCRGMSDPSYRLR